TISPCAQAWRVVPSPTLLFSALHAVTVMESSNVWGVGEYWGGSAYQTLVEHWDGTSWSIVTSPNVGSSDNYLESEVAIAANDVWAVGHYIDLGISRTLAEHWNGISWSLVATPNASSRDNFLYGATAVGVNEVWV